MINNNEVLFYLVEPYVLNSPGRAKQRQKKKITTCSDFLLDQAGSFNPTSCSKNTTVSVLFLIFYSCCSYDAMYLQLKSMQEFVKMRNLI